MDFGRIPYEKIQALDFTIPKIQSFLTQTYSTSLSLGCPFWSSDKFKGTIYSQDTKKEHFLRSYASQFDAIELNSTYHSNQTPGAIKNWVSEITFINKRFKFCPKLPKDISHHGHLDQNFESLKYFLNSVTHFEQHLGPSFLQLSPSFSPSQFVNLFSFIDSWPKDFPLAIELRHHGWFNGREIQQKLLDKLTKRNISLVITDTPGRQDVLHQFLTGEQLIIRYVSNSLHPKDALRINNWTQQLPKYSEQGIKHIYFFIHEEVESLYLNILSQIAASTQHVFSVRKPLNYGKGNPDQLTFF